MPEGISYKNLCGTEAGKYRDGGEKDAPRSEWENENTIMVEALIDLPDHRQGNKMSPSSTYSKLITS